MIGGGRHCFKQITDLESARIGDTETPGDASIINPGRNVHGNGDDESVGLRLVTLFGQLWTRAYVCARKQKAIDFLQICSFDRDFNARSRFAAGREDREQPRDGQLGVE